MNRARFGGVVCAVLLCTGTALAVPTAQQKCDNARVVAWKVYQSCVDAQVARVAKGIDWQLVNAPFVKCRRAYFKKWDAFQTKASLAATTCIGARYTDNGDLTVTDNLSGLVWEKKNHLGGIHDMDDYYTWSTGAPYKEDGTIFTSFLSSLNSAGFAGSNGWRLPTLAELQTTLRVFKCSGAFGGSNCSCPGLPCIDPALDAPHTQTSGYWSSTSLLGDPTVAWDVFLVGGSVLAQDLKANPYYVRAVRGGL